MKTFLKKIAKNAVTAVIVVVSVVTLNSCSKPEKGETGPQGSQGAPGNANVINHDITVHPSDWTYSNTYHHWYYKYYTNENNQSAVLGYVMSGNGKQAIPYYETTSGQQYDLANNLYASVPYIEFQYTNFNANTTAPTSDKYFYLVTMPPAMMVAHPNTNWKNYNEVKATLNL
jgi:hypothetical protein